MNDVWFKFSIAYRVRVAGSSLDMGSQFSGGLTKHTFQKNLLNKAHLLLDPFLSAIKVE
jgi:hypothetical protein